ncbi:hypothetical protein PPYR_04360 [Photinus pyralis]|uniref:Single domain-containing protein n=2 Tax=Photinus pyralis TaxID=7054 RepID=A0A5N4AXV8_PHOPY|nr:hypothetical protein PPYR_04360 [Photinus pyralis]
MCLIVHGWTAREQVEMDPNDPDVCVHETIGRFRVGESKSLHPKQCIRATCERGMVSKAGCGTVLTKPPCHVGSTDLSKPYPDCCPKVICPKN